MNKKTQVIEAVGISSEEAVGKPQLQLVLEYIAAQTNPIEFAQKVLDELSDLQANKKETTTVYADLKLIWNVESLKSPAKQFLEKFKPNSIERVAAYAAIITLFIQLATLEPDNPIIVNNITIQQIQNNYVDQKNQILYLYENANK
ncbi:hypothetical protein [Methylophaga sp.]|uniref:hypothetical protein n=1 Tax=Methylophaga sp. TaxID=2024840 RepID=UPI0025CCB858|nr:hypothetical protein [Methylophaga sp.]